MLARRWDKPTYFDWTVCAYFLVLSLSLALWPKAAGAILTEYAVTGIYVCLFAAAFFPPILGFEPFTYHYAKKICAPGSLGDPDLPYYQSNHDLRLGRAFRNLRRLLSLYPSVITRALIPITLILGVGVPFNLRFPDYYLRRLGLPGLAEMRKMGLEGRHGASVVSEHQDIALFSLPQPPTPLHLNFPDPTPATYRTQRVIHNFERRPS